MGCPNGEDFYTSRKRVKHDSETPVCVEKESFSFIQFRKVWYILASAGIIVNGGHDFGAGRLL